MDLEANKKNFIDLLKSCNREGMDKVIEYLNEKGFFTDPASTKYHGAYDGGLCEHCLNVYKEAVLIYKVQCHLKESIKDAIKDDNLIIASLLHDICKAGVYTRVKKWRKNQNDKWEQYETYDHDFSNMPFGHGEKSVIILLQLGLKLSEAEMCAIRWHMGAWDISDYSEAKMSFNSASDKTPLTSIIMAADSLATRIIEDRGTK